MQYEYKLLQIPVLGQDGEIEELDHLGEDGWLVVDIEHDYREGQRRYLLARLISRQLEVPIHEHLTSQATQPGGRPAWARG